MEEKSDMELFSPILRMLARYCDKIMEFEGDNTRLKKENAELKEEINILKEKNANVDENINRKKVAYMLTDDEARQLTKWIYAIKGIEPRTTYPYTSSQMTTLVEISQK